MLDHERLDVYGCSLDLVARASELTSALPKGYSALGDQLRRASISIPLNIAEGAGKTSLRERARFHSIARGSAMECGAILDVIGRLGLAKDDDLSGSKALVVRIVSMLSKMCR